MSFAFTMSVLLLLIVEITFALPWRQDVFRATPRTQLFLIIIKRPLKLVALKVHSHEVLERKA
jgi:hypothetical protein